MKSSGRAAVSDVEKPGWHVPLSTKNCVASILDRQVCLWILRLLAAICGWKETARVLPKSERNRHGIDVELVPPSCLVTLAVDFAVMCAAKWTCELVAHLAAECAGLRKPKMVSLARLPATQGARL